MNFSRIVQKFTVLHYVVLLYQSFFVISINVFSKFEILWRCRMRSWRCRKNSSRVGMGSSQVELATNSSCTSMISFCTWRWKKNSSRVGMGSSQVELATNSSCTSMISFCTSIKFSYFKNIYMEMMKKDMSSSDIN